MVDSIFTKIINREIDSNIIYEDDLCIVILDAFPLTKGHSLVIAKEQIKELSLCSDELSSHLIKVSKDITLLLKEKLDCDGVTVFQNEGLLQEIEHVHIHVMPTYKDEVGVKFVKTDNNYDLKEVLNTLTK